MTDGSISILGVPVGRFALATLLTRLQAMLHQPGCAYTYGVNAYALNLACRNQEFFQHLVEADLIFADGASLLLAARVLGGRLPEKITTTDLWPKMCELAVQQHLKFYLLGGEPGLAERARDKTRQQYPGLAIVGCHDGYNEIFVPQTIAAINEVQPDIIWVGLGDPLQGRWANVMRSQLNAKLIITCGGMFKIVAGELQRVSYAWQQRGLEWLFRLWQEPQTWKRYLLGLPLFGLRVLHQRFTDRPSRTRSNPTTL